MADNAAESAIDEYARNKKQRISDIIAIIDDALEAILQEQMQDGSEANDT